MMAFSFAPNIFLARATTAVTCKQGARACAVPHTKEPSYPVPAAGKNLPDVCRGTTIYYNIPSVPEHLSTSPAPSHPLDGDAYVLAFSFPASEEGVIWIRGRFARTKPFMLEARAGKRMYRGIYGTPGATGWNAPLKPRASCVNGIVCWGDEGKPKVLVFGPLTLPLIVGGGTLISRGPTALGDILTDSQELVRERGTEICLPPVRYSDVTVVLSLGRNLTGTLTGAFVTEKGGRSKRYPRMNIPKSAIFTALSVSQNFIVIAMCVTRAAPSNLLSSLLGKSASKEPPLLDLKQGTVLTVLDRNRGLLGSIRMSGVIISHLNVSENGGELVMNGLCLSANEMEPLISLRAISDALSGNIWASQHPACLRSEMFAAAISLNDLSEGSQKTLSKGDLSFCCFEQDLMMYEAVGLTDLDKTNIPRCACLTYNTSTLRAGVKAFGSKFSSQGVWFTPSMDDRLSGLVMDQDASYVAVLRTKTGASSIGGELLMFDVSTIEDGPITTINLDSEKFGTLQSATGAVWAQHSIEWSEESSKPIKSAYEIFDSRGWNDIDSSFSSLGINQ